jgi:hypothetical protein
VARLVLRRDESLFGRSNLGYVRVNAWRTSRLSLRAIHSGEGRRRAACEPDETLAYDQVSLIKLMHVTPASAFCSSDTSSSEIS